MAATNRSKDDLINESTGLYKDNTAGDISAADLRDGIYSIFQPQGICQGRLTLESGVPVSTSDQTAKTNVYFTPYLGNCIGLYDGTSWKLFTFTEKTLALGTLTSGLNYDVYIYDNAGTLTLESLAWTNDTTRATAIVLQDGVYCKTGALTRRYLGTFRTTSTTTTEDSKTKRFLWNMHNRQRRPLYVTDAADSWTLTSSAGWYRANASDANRVEVIVGVAGQSQVSLVANDIGKHSVTSGLNNGIGENSITAFSGTTGYHEGGGYSILTAKHETHPQLGYSYFAWLEYHYGSGTTTFGGDFGTPTVLMTGLSGSIDT